MSGLELVPIGTILSILVDQVISTAIAANDVLIEKECFKTLSNYLFDIEPIFVELKYHGLDDIPIVRSTLDSLQKDCKKAQGIVEKYTNCGRFYSFLFCRRIANEVQDATRAIGRSLDLLPLANTEVLSKLSDKMNRLQAEMQKAEFVISKSSLMTLEKLNNGIQEQNHDRNFRNSMLEQIALSVGISIETSEIRKELNSLRMEKEEAAARKEKQEEIFLKQVIELLSNADVVCDDEEIRKQYDLIKSIVEKSEIRNGRILEYNAYLCPITKSVMVDPVDLCSGTTCERSAIEALFQNGNIKDPRTGHLLEDLTLKPNISVRQSILQWKEQNDCLKIRQAKEILQSGKSSTYDEALCIIQKVIKGNLDTKVWIAMEGLIDIIVLLLGTSDHNLKSRSFQTLLDIVERHSQNKDKAVAAGVLNHIAECMGLDFSVCTAAVNLLFELLQENDRYCQVIPQEDRRWNQGLCRKLKQQNDTISFLVVIILDKQFSELAKKAEDILFQLCCNDDATILSVASSHWYKPLVQRLRDGPESSKKSMMKGLEGMQLSDEDVKQLGEDGVINPLVKLATAGDESKKLAFSLMAKLSTFLESRKFIVEAGAFSLIFEQLLSQEVSIIIRENCSEILEKLTSNDMEFLTGLGVIVPDQELMITNLLDILPNSTTSIGIRKPALRALLSICNSAKAAAEKVVTALNGISCILPLLWDSDNEIRELALQFVHQFSHNELIGIADFLLDERRLETFMSFLSDGKQQKIQILAVQLLANLQNAKIELIKSLDKLGAIPVLLKILETGTKEEKENVLNLLSGFMNPADIYMQKRVVECGAYPLLVNILRSGSNAAKARAAELIGKLSLNSPKMTKVPNWTYLCFCGTNVSTCEVHGGICSVESSFCLLKSDALAPMVRLLQEDDDMVKLQAVRTLKTLVQKGFESRGANVLQHSKAIDSMLHLLSEGDATFKEEVLEVLKIVFKYKEIIENKHILARESLLKLSLYSKKNANNHLREEAEKLLATLELYSQSGSMPQ